MFLLISGAAASGKTTIVRALAARYSQLACHDADEILVTTARERWEVLERWVQQALIAQAQGCHFVLAGQSPLGELLTCPSAVHLNGIAACLLDCDDLVRIARIRMRGIDPAWPPTQHTMNWASWQRMHAADPQWEQAAITHACPFPEHLARWSHWQAGDPRWLVHRIETSALSPSAGSERVAMWIDQCMREPSSLSQATKWWETP